MSSTERPLIVGAGPVGLGAGLFLARQGLVPRIVEQRDEANEQSRALAVNPRTLHILEPTGVTERMLELGSPIHAARFHRQGRTVAKLSFAGVHPKYPFMLALSQATTERLLAQALDAAGGAVERGMKMVQCRSLNDRAEAALEPSAGGPRQTVRCPWLLAADGAHSTARQQLGIDFAGSSFAREWNLADAPIRTPLASDQAHVFFLDEGVFLFMIRVVDPLLENRSAAPLWRVISNAPRPLSRLVRAEQAGPATWASNFSISHRISATMASGGVYFAGDAAHIHSPVGARGMNLGLKDAWAFAELVRADRLAEYDRLRRPVDDRVVRRVERLSRLASAESSFDRFARSWLFPMATRLPLVRSRMVATVTGLDHKLPRIGAGRPSGTQPGHRRN